MQGSNPNLTLTLKDRPSSCSKLFTNFSWNILESRDERTFFLFLLQIYSEYRAGVILLEMAREWPKWCIIFLCGVRLIQVIGIPEIGLKWLWKTLSTILSRSILWKDGGGGHNRLIWKGLCSKSRGKRMTQKSFFCPFECLSLYTFQLWWNV